MLGHHTSIAGTDSSNAMSHWLSMIYMGSVMYIMSITVATMYSIRFCSTPLIFNAYFCDSESVRCDVGSE